jgi:WD40 repeat protein
MKKYFFILFITITQITFAQKPELILPNGHSKEVTFIAFTNNDKYLVSASEDASIITWEISSGKILNKMQFGSRITSLQISPNGKTALATFDYEDPAIIWNIETNNIIAKLIIPKTKTMMEIKGYVKWGNFSPDGKTIALYFSFQYQLVIFDASNGKLKEVISTIDKKFNNKEISPDYFEFDNTGKNILLTYIYNNNIELWDIKNKKIKFFIEGNTSKIHKVQSKKSKSKDDVNDINNMTQAAHIDINNKYILSPGTWNTKARIYSFNSGVLLKEFSELKKTQYAQFSRDGNKILLQGYDSTHIYNTKDFKKIKSIWFNTSNGGFKLNFNNDNKSIVYYKNEDLIEEKIEEKIEPKIIKRINFERINKSESNNDGSLLFTSEGFGNIGLYDLKKSYQKPLFQNKFNENYQVLLLGNNLVQSKRNDKVTITNLKNTKTYRIDNLINKDVNFFYKLNSMDNDSLVIVYKNDLVVIYDVKNRKQIQKFSTSYPYSVQGLLYNKKLNIVITYGLIENFKGKLIIWDINTGSEIKSKITTNYDYDVKLVLNPMLSSLILISSESFYTYDLNTLNTLSNNITSNHLSNKIEGIYFDKNAGFSKNYKYFYIQNLNSIHLWNASQIKDSASHIYDQSAYFCISEDEKYIYTMNYYDSCKQFDIITNKLIFQFYGGSALITEKNGNLVFWRGNDEVVFFKAGVQKPYTKIILPSNSKIDLIDFENNILVSHLNAITKIHKITTGKEVVSIIGDDDDQYLFKLSSNEYLTTKNTSTSLRWKWKDKTLDFNQLDIKYNRPDRVLAALGCTDTSTIIAYKNAYLKRMKKLQIDTSKLNDKIVVPDFTITNKSTITYKQKTDLLQLKIHCSDSITPLNNFNIWVNEIPLFGSTGKKIAQKHSYDTIINVQLLQGDNKIEASVTNLNAIESFKEPLYVNNVNEDKKKYYTHFIGIGIDSFKNNNYNLKYSVKDIKDLVENLKIKFSNNLLIDTLFNENVTISNVKALKKKLLQTNIGDKVIIAYSGHGLLSKDYDYFLSSYSVDFEKPEINGIAYEDLENLIDSIPARKKLMIIDACHSGEVDKEEGILINIIADSVGLSKGGVVGGNKKQNQLGLQNSFELMKNIFADVGKNTGATIISAAAGNQFALEKGELKNGVFTYSILDAMRKNKTITLSELKKLVSVQVVLLSNGLQKPTFRTENLIFDWDIW